MSAQRDDPVPEPGRADWSQIVDAPHAVVGDVPDIEAARLLIEELENHGVPSHAIALIGTEAKGRRHDDTGSEIAESRVLANVSKSVVVGGGLGIVLGGLLGLLMAAIIPDLAWYWGALMGGVFGAALGGAAGGMSVAKYSSPAWDETYQVEDESEVKVAVHHAEIEVIDNAETVMNGRVEGDVKRLDRPE